MAAVLKDENATPIDDNRILLVLLCGLPGAGKTTLAGHLQQSITPLDLIPTTNLKNPSLSFHHICYDSYLFQHLRDHQTKDGNIHFDNTVWKQSRNAAFNQTESLIVDHIKQKSSNPNSTHSQNTSNPQDISYTLLLVDDNKQYRSMRYKFYKLAKQYQTGFLILFMDTDKEECIRRNAKRKGLENVDEAVINRMSDQFQPPNDAKYAWESNYCHIVKYVSNESIQSENESAENTEDDDTKTNVTNSSEINLKDLYDVISGSWNKIPIPNKSVDEKEQNAARMANAKNLKHQTDLKLRKEMSRWMKSLKTSTDADGLKEMSKQIGHFRKDTLKEVGKCVVDDAEEMQMMIENYVLQFNDFVSDYCAMISVQAEK